jgi:hypothetical protein
MLRIPLAIAVLLSASSALAGDAGERPRSAVTLKYLRSPASASCPGPDVLRAQVAERLRYDLVSAEAPEHLAVRIERWNGRYRATGEIRDHDGRVVYTPGKVEDPSCDQAVKNMAILLAVHFTRPRQVSPTVAPPAPPPARAPPPSRLPPGQPVQLQYGLAGAVAINLAPTVVGGPAWFVGARLSSVSVEIEGRALFAPVFHANGIPMQASVMTGAVSACLHAGVLFGCARFELGALRYTGAAELRIDPPNPVLAGFGARAGAEWPVAKHVFLRGYADVLTLATTLQLRLRQNNQPLWTSFLMSPSFGVGVGASF